MLCYDISRYLVFWLSVYFALINTRDVGADRLSPPASFMPIDALALSKHSLSLSNLVQCFFDISGKSSQPSY